MCICVFFFLKPNGNRGFLVHINGVATEVRISDDLVKALIKWNGSIYRRSEHFDEKFVKGLLVSFVGIKKICNNEVQHEIVELIRGELNEICVVTKQLSCEL